MIDQSIQCEQYEEPTPTPVFVTDQPKNAEIEHKYHLLKKKLKK